MDWDLVQLFVDVIDAGSMSEAARRRGVTRSGISQQLKRLEKQANAQLLRRTTRDLEPTDVGLTLYEHGKRIALQFQAAQLEVAALGGTVAGLVRIRVPPAIGQRSLAPALIEFARANPAVNLRVTFNNRFRNLIEAGIDIAVMIGNEPPEDTVCRDLGPIRWQLFCTPRYLASLQQMTQPEDLAAASFLSRSEGRKVDLELVSRERRVQVTLTPRFTSENVIFLQTCALADMGITLLPAYMAHDLVAAGQLVQVLPEYSSVGVDNRVLILTVPNRYPSRATQAVIDVLRKTLRAVVAESSEQDALRVER